MDIILTFIAPYIMYIVANEMGVSGVLAVVAGGMYMSFHITSILAASTYNKAVAVWDIFRLCTQWSCLYADRSCFA